MKIIFSKNASRGVAKIHFKLQSKYFLLISDRFFGHFNQKNQCLVKFEYCEVNIQSLQI